MKKITALSTAWLVVLMLFLSGCGSSETKGDGEKKVIVGVTQIVEHPSLDAAFEGFKLALEENGYVEGENVEYDVQIAQGDPNNNATIANNFVGDQVDLIFANSTPSAQSALNATEDIPIIFTSVTDPVGAELVPAFDQPGENITGTSDTHPEAISKTVEFMMNEIGAKKIGVIYNAGEQNSAVQVEEVKKLVEANGGEIVEVSVATSAEVKQAADSLVGRVDAMYMPTDNTVVSALESIVAVANDKDIPLFAGDLDSMKRGALAASGFNYKDLGYETGLMAVKVLKGEKKPSELDVGYPQSFNLVVNKEAAQEQGVDLKDSWDAELYEGE
ncbi:ABC transporter substrate binding protein [Bacillus sp. 2205SS5-2]|uniref:ABC transporter substrate-binding protein n=1 Tax=Bacillus sp. 2205SS5-2 TaxID=3109031 RepID=UPI003FA56D00